MNEITMKLNADRLIRMALEEDITSEDITTNSVMRKKQMGEVQLLCKETGVIAGIWVFERVFTLLDENTETEFYVKDGDKVEKGQLLGLVKGDIRVLLSGERTALNYLQRMSGIATYTSQIADLLKGSRTKLLDTRKTTPNMRIFEKYAVKTGGGYNHRYNLSDGILLKDNHIGAAGSVKKAVEMGGDRKSGYGERSSGGRGRYHYAGQYDSGNDERSGSSYRRQSSDGMFWKCDKRKYRKAGIHRRRLYFQRRSDSFCADPGPFSKESSCSGLINKQTYNASYRP